MHLPMSSVKCCLDLEMLNMDVIPMELRGTFTESVAPFTNMVQL